MRFYLYFFIVFSLLVAVNIAVGIFRPFEMIDAIQMAPPSDDAVIEPKVRNYGVGLYAEVGIVDSAGIITAYRLWRPLNILPNVHLKPVVVGKLIKGTATAVSPK